MNIELLKAAFIPEREWKYCYISENGMIFTPRYDDYGVMTQTGEQAYHEYMTVSTASPVSAATPQEQINAMLLRELASLKAQVSVQ